MFAIAAVHDKYRTQITSIPHNRRLERCQASFQFCILQPSLSLRERLPLDGMAIAKPYWDRQGIAHVQGGAGIAAPLVLTALRVAIPARPGLVVIGGEAALALGGLATATAALPLAGADAKAIGAHMLGSPPMVDLP